ncbi:hypothetical protein I302_103056 [Kwoniella bestiolae CBS 10118]|uniref:Uncharacterized protein n=1 Tax=Kwoniella bestiolae CBS 10118 TaxID=1296100 RepID=A0A1B9GGW9_9TREE|nr:hypothetical protein I302_01754 [Kwoniella bestiolae CBS 10118]OCF30235.1 hypothetical protein I302_01754 [Kwoniella bestiolae CBS 10118]
MSFGRSTQDLPSIATSVGTGTVSAPSNEAGNTSHTLEDPAKQALLDEIDSVSGSCQRQIVYQREKRPVAAEYTMAIHKMTIDFLTDLKNNITCENPDDSSSRIKESWVRSPESRLYENDWPTIGQWHGKREEDINKASGRKYPFTARIMDVLPCIEVNLKNCHSSSSHTRRKPKVPYDSEGLVNRAWDFAWVRSTEGPSYDAGIQSSFDSYVTEFEHELSGGATERDNQIPDRTWWSKFNPFSRSSQRSGQKERKWCCI